MRVTPLQRPLLLLVLLLSLHAITTHNQPNPLNTHQTTNTTQYANPTIFETTWGGGGFDAAYGTAVDSSGNIYVTGITTSFGSSQTLLLKFNSTGSLLWQRAWPGTNQLGASSTAPSAMALDPEGDVYITGSIQFSTPGAGFQEAMLLKYDSNGNLIWEERIQEVSRGQAITVATSGSIYVTGGLGGAQSLILKFSPNGTLTWKTAWTGYDAGFATAIAVDAAEDIYLAGYTNSYTGTLLKLNSTGSILWQEQLFPPSSTYQSTITPIYALTLDSSGNGYATGSASIRYTNSSSSWGISVFKFNPDGTLNWTRLVQTGPGSSRGSGLAADSGGDVAVTGQVGSFSTATSGILLMQLSSNGDLAWETGRGGVSDAGAGAAFDSDHNLILAGSVYEAPPYPVTLLFDYVTSNDMTLQPIQGYMTTPNATVTSMSIPTLTPAGSQTYSGSYDAYVLKTQPPPPEPPSPPTVLVAQGTPTNISLSWNQPQSSGSQRLTGYRVYRGLSSGNEKPLVNLTNTRRYVDLDVRGGNTYYYYITAVNGVGESGSSNENSATVGVVGRLDPLLLAIPLAGVGAIVVLILFQQRRRKYVHISH